MSDAAIPAFGHCPACHGSGEGTEIIGICRETGWTLVKPCPACNGAGEAEIESYPAGPEWMEDATNAA